MLMLISKILSRPAVVRSYTWEWNGSRQAERSRLDFMFFISSSKLNLLDNGS